MCDSASRADSLAPPSAPPIPASSRLTRSPLARSLDLDGEAELLALRVAGGRRADRELEVARDGLGAGLGRREGDLEVRARLLEASGVAHGLLGLLDRHAG